MMTDRLCTLLAGTVLASLLMAACQPLVMPETASPPEAHAVHWGYEGDDGPAHWGDLSDAYAACATGVAQSPIDLTSATAEDLTDIAFNYGESKLNILNNGHTVQVDYDGGSSITVGGVQYNLSQFHFHAGSEHTIDGEQFPLEFHLVHRSADDKLAVIGVMAVEGAENPAFADILAHAPASEAAVATVQGVMVAAESLLPANRLFYAYDGSLTTPPCSEGVKWHVMRESIEMSAAQIDALAAILHHNFRPVQPLGDRTLKVDTATN